MASWLWRLKKPLLLGPLGGGMVAPKAPVASHAAVDAAAPEALATTAHVAESASGTTATPGAPEASPLEGPASTAPTPDVGESSSDPQRAAEEELEVVFGRPLLPGSLHDDAVPLPCVLLQPRRSLEEAEAVFRRE